MLIKVEVMWLIQSSNTVHERKSFKGLDLRQDAVERAVEQNR